MVFNGVCYITAAIFLAIALIFTIHTGLRAADRRPWIFLGIALFMMLVFRVLSFYGTSDSTLLERLRAVGPVVAVLISIFLFISLFYIRWLDQFGQTNKSAAEHNRSLFERITATSPDVLFVYDVPSLRHTFVSEAVKPVLGFTAQEFVRLPIENIVHPQDLPAVQNWLKSFQTEGGDDVREIDYRIRHADGSIRHINLRASIFQRDPSGVVRELVGAAQDVTEKRERDQRREELIDAERIARTEAERANRLKDEFLATLSHELRTPLNAILGWSQLLRRDTSSVDGEFEEGLVVIERNARIQVRLVEDLLDMSRIISGKLRIDATRVQLFPVIEAAVDAVRPAARAREITLITRFDADLPVVRGDAARLQQVVWNLLSNAIKFTPHGGTVRASATARDDRVLIEIADNGQGIAPEFLPYVFERFRQADGSSTRRHGGLGLGLAIVKNLVELHGGTVSATSGGEGAGSTFRVELPQMKTTDAGTFRPSGPDLSPSAEPGLSLAGVSVLVVDDERDARELVSRVLVAHGAEVQTAASATEALALLSSWRPNVLLSDIGMPEQDGYDLIRAVRQLPVDAGGAVPAAALTAFARSEDRRRTLQAGFQSHVAKPVEPAELIAVVASLNERFASSS